MRALASFLVAVGFLAVLAISWAPSEEATPSIRPSAATSLAPSRLDRTPASVPSASFAEIHRLEACYSSQACAFPKTDASSYRFAVSEALAIALAEHFTNFGADAELARSSIKSPEPIVQVVALRMLSALPPSPENLSALENGLRNSSDSTLVEPSLKELKRYLGSSLETDAQGIVEELIGKGVLMGSTLVVPFINEHSYQEFRDLMKQLEPGAEAQKFLGAALRDYEAKH